MKNKKIVGVFETTDPIELKGWDIFKYDFSSLFFIGPHNDTFHKWNETKYPAVYMGSSLVDEKDKVFEPLYKKLKDMKNVEYNSNVSNEEIRKELVNSHIFAYPSIWPESCCLAAIEAMSAKNLLVLPNLAALKETGSKSKFLYNFWIQTKPLRSKWIVPLVALTFILLIFYFFDEIFFPPNFSINQFQRGFIKHWMRPVWVDLIQGSQNKKTILNSWMR